MWWIIRGCSIWAQDEQWILGRVVWGTFSDSDRVRCCCHLFHRSVQHRTCRLGTSAQYSLASWKSAAMASSHHWESRVTKGSSTSPRRKISWPAVRATVAIRLHARIMSNCTLGDQKQSKGVRYLFWSALRTECIRQACMIHVTVVPCSISAQFW